jgi:hypothetical protein
MTKQKHKPKYPHPNPSGCDYNELEGEPLTNEQGWDIAKWLGTIESGVIPHQPFLELPAVILPAVKEYARCLTACNIEQSRFYYPEGVDRDDFRYCMLSNAMVIYDWLMENNYVQMHELIPTMPGGVTYVIAILLRLGYSDTCFDADSPYTSEDYDD